MSKKMTLVLRPGHEQFRRTVRRDGEPVLDDNGEPRVLTFQAGQPLELTAEEVEAVKDDVGVALFVAKPDDGKPSLKIDREATDQFVKQRDEQKAKATAKAEKVESKAAPAKDLETKAK
jgi:hypothetical protein